MKIEKIERGTKVEVEGMKASGEPSFKHQQKASNGQDFYNFDM